MESIKRKASYVRRNIWLNDNGREVNVEMRDMASWLWGMRELGVDNKAMACYYESYIVI